MNAYTLNEQGQHYVAAFVREKGKDGLVTDAFFGDAENAANDAFDREMTAIIEIRGQLAFDGRPHALTIDQAWFDSIKIDE